MAEAVLFDIATNIILKLSSGVLDEIGLWWGVNDELQKLKNTVSTIRAVLLDAEEQYSKSNQVKDWLGKLKEAVYDANDLLDLFSTQALKKQTMTGTKLGKEVRLFFSSSNQFAYGLKMAHKIKSIRERLDEINADKSFHLEVRLVEHVAMVSWEREQTHSSPPNEVVGRGDDKTEIMKVLLFPDFENNVSVISIVGFGGLGKTTLAQLLLNDDQVRTHFKLKLWVSVAENFDLKSVVEKILESIRGEKPKNLEMDSLKNQLLESIRATKYLLVLDDVWNEDPKKWFDLMDLLVKGADGSKIIITTRLRKVAMIAKSILVHELKGLSNVESWELFKNFAFLGGMPSPSIEKIGNEIVEKCVGVPLAIKTIGSLLYFKDTESEWLSFKDEELSSINQQQNDILPTLRLSYNHLPSHLKHCFAYCRLFPKDYRINVESLAELWIAQGFVQPSNVTLNVKDIGLQYFKDLLLRSFFQEVDVDIWGNISTCKMHDLMHDLAILVAREECTSLNSTGYVDEKARHISVDFDLGFTWQHLPSLLKASKARTLLLVNKHKVVFVGNMYTPEYAIGKEECDLIFCNLKCMRVLDLHSLGIERVPHSIKKLELLRYLDLSYNHWLKKLSNSISKLPNLQVLKVDYCERLEHWPKHINKLVSLSSLSMVGCHRLTHMPCGIGQLKGLMKLSTFIVDKQRCGGAGLNELNHLNNLRGNLRIENLRHVQNPEFVNLREKQHLRALELWWNPYGDEDENGEFVTDIGNDEMVLEVLQPHQNLKVLSLNFYRGAKLSSWISSLTALVEFQLSDCRNIQCFPPLDNFPALKTLE